MDDQYNYEVFNLGCGTGYSVLEVIASFEKFLGYKLEYKLAPRREGDMARLVAVPKKANEKMNWSTKKDLDDICRSCLHFIEVTLKKASLD